MKFKIFGAVDHQSLEDYTKSIEKYLDKILKNSYLLSLKTYLVDNVHATEIITVDNFETFKEYKSIVK